MLRDDLQSLMLRLSATGRGDTFEAAELAGMLRQPVDAVKTELAKMQKAGLLWSNGSGAGPDHQKRIYRLARR